MFVASKPERSTFQILHTKFMLQALTSNIILVCKGLDGTNTLVYYKKFNYVCKKFKNIDTRGPML